MIGLDSGSIPEPLLKSPQLFSTAETSLLHTYHLRDLCHTRGAWVTVQLQHSPTSWLYTDRTLSKIADIVFLKSGEEEASYICSLGKLTKINE